MHNQESPIYSFSDQTDGEDLLSLTTQGNAGSSYDLRHDDEAEVAQEGLMQDTQENSLPNKDQYCNVHSPTHLSEEELSTMSLLHREHQWKTRASPRKTLGVCFVAVTMMLCIFAIATLNIRELLNDTPESTQTDFIISGSLSDANTFQIPLQENPASDERAWNHRWLEDATEFACSDFYNTTFNGTEWDNGDEDTIDDEAIFGASCRSIGQIQLDDAVTMYQQFCPNWPFDENATNPECDFDGAVDEIMLTCNNRKTRVFGGEHFADGGYPEQDGMFIVFPAPTNSNVLANYFFTARQLIPDPSGGPNCVQDFRMKFYCKPDSNRNCLVISTVEPENKCAGNVELCPSSMDSSFASNRNLRSMSS